ncbi:hypothetical protein BH09MYX1_BH09MYX1_57180 [soil metagenome]
MGFGIVAAFLLTTRVAFAEPPPPPASVLRFRGGIGALGGVTFGGPGAAFAIQGRVGVQFNGVFALFLEPELLAGGGSGGVLGLVSLSPIFELTLADHFFVGIGPCVQFGAYAANTGNIEPAITGGAKLRLGLGFGSSTPLRRQHFTIALETRLLVSPETGTGMLLGIAMGYDAK